NDCAYLSADEFAESFIGFRIHDDVIECESDPNEFACVPHGFVARLALFFRGLHGADFGEFDRHTKARPARPFAVTGTVAFIVGQPACWYRAVVRWDREVRRALEYGQLFGLSCDQRDRLYAG